MNARKPNSGDSAEYLGLPVRWIGPDAVVDVAGEVNISTCLPFQRGLLSLLESRPRKLVVNLTQVAFMDSSGVASLVKVLARARKTETSLWLAAMGPQVKGLFEITRLTSIFAIGSTVEEALA